jgi:hypothetical protein
VARRVTKRRPTLAGCRARARRVANEPTAEWERREIRQAQEQKPERLSAKMRARRDSWMRLCWLTARQTTSLFYST